MAKLSFIYSDYTQEQAKSKLRKYRNYPKKYSYLKDTKYRSSYYNFLSFITSLSIRAKIRDK